MGRSQGCEGEGKVDEEGLGDTVVASQSSGDWMEGEGKREGRVEDDSES